jgi:hypothetical protein
LPVAAQDKDLINAGYSYTGMKRSDTVSNAVQVDVKVRMPLLNGNKQSILLTWGYKNLTLNGIPALEANNLHGFICQGVWLRKYDGNKSITLVAQVGLFSDMRDVSGNDFRYSGAIRYRIKHSAKLNTGWGLGYARQYFGNQVIPFIDVDYKPNTHWSITGQLPIKPKILYHISDKLRAGLEIAGEATSYRLSAADNNRFIQINQWSCMTRLEYQLFPNWQLNLGMGKNIRHSYKMFEDALTNPWTVITFPLGERAEPIQQIDTKNLCMQLSISFDPF